MDSASCSSWDNERNEDDFSVSTSTEEDSDKTETDDDESVELSQSSTVLAPITATIDDDPSTISTSATASLPSAIVLFRIGDQVKVDDLLLGSITDLDMESNPPEATVRYTIGGSVEDGIEFHRIKVVNTISLSHLRSGTNRFSSPAPQPNTTSASTNEQEEGRDSTTNNGNERVYESFKDAVLKSVTILTATDEKRDHPLFEFLKHETDTVGREYGWLRKTFPFSTYEGRRKRLNNTEGNVLVTAYSLFSGLAGGSIRCHGWATLLSFAFGLHRNSLLNTYRAFVVNNFENTVIPRCDKGTSIFTSERLRTKTFTAFNTFKKRKLAEFRDSTETIPLEELREEFDSLEESEKNDLKILAERDLERSRTLWDELKEFLLRSKGKVSFEVMAAHLNNIVSVNTIHRFVQKQAGYGIYREKLLPHLNSGCKEKRHIWSHTFWYIWKSVRAIPHRQVQVVLIHMDEKWFFVIKTRGNCKMITSIGLERTNRYVHHKNHVGKCMYVVVTAFLPNNNDITAGGKVIPIACIRVGKMVTAKRDTYKRVYKPDGTYTYPVLPENRLRTKGEEYFQQCELTGASEGTEKKPKCSLLKMYQEQIVPAIEEKVVRKLELEGKTALVIKQEDGAGVHRKKQYKEEMERIFREKNWILFNQPPNSPITNVHDACIFPMMSKQVSRNQAMTFGCRVLKMDQLHSVVMQVWNDKTNREAMARSFAGHHQVVSTIMEEKGNNEYFSKKGGLSFGVRKAFVCDRDGDGVVPIRLSPETFEDTDTYRVINNRRCIGLKHSEPKMNELNKAELTEEQKRILSSNMKFDEMDEELRAEWLEITAEEQAVEI